MSRRSGKAPGAIQGRSSNNNPFLGKPNLKESTLRNMSGMGVGADVETRTCPVCECEVGVRKSDGQLRSHRVGTSRKQAWNCPGAVANSDRESS